MKGAVVKLITLTGNDDLLLSAADYDYPRRPLKGVRFFLQVEDIEAVSAEWYRDCGKKYHVTVGCVCRAEVTGDKLAALLSSVGLTADQWATGSAEAKDEELIRSGYKAVFWQDSGNGRTKLIDQGRGKLNGVGNDFELFYQYMDKPQNRIGATGYSFIRGEFGAEGLTMKQVVEAAVREEQRQAEGK